MKVSWLSSIYLILILCSRIGLAINPPAEADLFPTCALTCFTIQLVGAPEIAEDIKKLCRHVEVEIALAACVRNTCNKDDQTKVQIANANICDGEPVANRAPMAVVILGILGTITQGIIGLRIYARKYVSVIKLGVDDYLIVVASTFVAFVMISGTADVFLGLGKHTFNSKQSALEPTLFIFWLDELAYQITMALVKSSILYFYLRLFPENGFRKIVYALLVLVNITGAVFFFVTLFQCNPVRGVFDKSIDFVCIDNNTATFASSGISIATDFTILLLPIPRLLRLKVSRRKRNSVLVMFSFGFLASIVSVARLPFIVEFGKSVDPIFEQIVPGIWTFAEMATAVIAACLPSLRPLGDKWKWFPKFFAADEDTLIEPSPSPRNTQLALRPNVAMTMFNSLFSRSEIPARLADKREYFGIEDGMIVAVRSLCPRLSVDFSSRKWGESVDVEKGVI